MGVIDLLKPLGVFVLVIVVILGLTAGLGFSAGEAVDSGPSPDGESVEGQSPSDWQPDEVVVDSDAEEGTIEVDANTEGKRILVDTRHSNQFERADLEPLADALFESQHEVRFEPSSDDDGFGDTSGYNATLQKFDAVLVIAPTGSFSEEEISGLKAYARGGGRVVVLSEPTQNRISGGGLFGGGVSRQRYTGNDITAPFGMRLGDGVLYNIDDEQNDNNFKSIHAERDGQSRLTDGVDEVSLDTAGRIVTTREADGLLTAVEGTNQLESRRSGEYTVAAHNDNVVLVADSSFIKTSERYDADNERFISNLLRFMVTGDKPDDVPSSDEDEGEEETPGPPDDGFSDEPAGTTGTG